MFNLTKKAQFGGAGMLLMLGFTLPVAAETAHSDAISCYAYVHSQCYGNGENNCSQEDYEWGLDQCDGYYPTKGLERPERPGGLKASRSNTRTRATIESSFNKGR